MSLVHLVQSICEGVCTYLVSVSVDGLTDSLTLCKTLVRPEITREKRYLDICMRQLLFCSIFSLE